MSNYTKHLVIYSPENEKIANSLSQTLQSAGHEAMIMEKPKEDFSEQLGQISLPPSTEAIFLLTENYLKSYGCMNGVLQATHNWGDAGRLTVLVANGIKKGEEGEEIEVVTKFERVGDIIQYMNYWQDKYLTLRKEKRSRPKDEILAEKIAITKEISGDVGEFLRYVRGMGYYSLPEFYEKYKIKPVENQTVATETPEPDNENEPEKADKSLVEMIEDSSEALMAENASLKEEQATEPVSDEILNAIPGIGLLDQKSPNGDAPEVEKVVKEENEMAFEDFTKKEMQKIDEENDELLGILDEVMEEEEQGVNAADTPVDGDDFDIDSLFEEEEELKAAPTLEETPVGEDEVLVALVEEDETEALEADEILEQAVQYFREEQNEQGITHLEGAVESLPTETSLRYYYAYALARYDSNFEKAETELNTLLEQDSEHPDAWFLKGELLENKQEFAKAKDCFESVIDINPAFPDVHYRVGLLLAEQINAPEKAAEHLKIAVKQNEKNVDAHYMLASLMSEKLEMPEKAVTHFRKALNLHPNHPFANYDLALVYHSLKDKERASEYYEKAATINPELKTEQNDLAFGLMPNTLEEAVVAVAPLEEAETTVVNGISVANDPELEKLQMLEDIPDEMTTEAKAVEVAPLLDDQSTIEEIPDELVAPVNGVQPEPAKKEALSVTLDENSVSNVDTKVVLITGATSGIGKATAEIFAQNGYRVIMTGRRMERLNELSNSLSTTYNTDCHTLSFDVRDTAAVEKALENLPDEWKKVDILINNAGLSRGLDPIHEGSIKDWETMIDTNVKGLLYMTRAISPFMAQRKNGHIINVSSIAGTEVYPGGNVYSASKAAVSSLTRSMRLDLSKHNIRVSQISPGHVEETEFASVRFNGDEERAAKTYENFQPLTSRDVAETLYFIATRPPHVNIVDIYMYGTQQANATTIERSGR